MKIIIIRHADPDYPNNTLTEKGFVEAEALGKKYSYKDFDEIYCSPLNRAKYTCDAIVKNEGKYEVVDWLQEFGYPIKIDGKNAITWDFKPNYFEHLESIYDYDKYLDTELMKSGNIKEEINKVYQELDMVLLKNGYTKEGKVFKAIKSNKKKIVFVCHFGIMSVLMSYFMNIPFCVIGNHFCAVPTGVTEFVTEEREDGICQFRMLKFGDTSHLEIANIKESFAGRFCETFDSNERH